MYHGKKFNSKKEDVPEERYLGIMVFRFYVNCIRCNALVSLRQILRTAITFASMEHRVILNHGGLRQTQRMRLLIIRKNRR